MPAFRTSHLLAGCAVLAALGSTAARAADAPSTVVTQAAAAESKLRPKPPAAKPAAAKPVAAAPAPAPAAAETTPPVSAYVCVTNSCSTQKMLPLVSEADQAAAAEAEAAEVRAIVREAATRIAARTLNLTLDGGDGEADIVLTPVVDEADEEN